jgi:hypothetical protein
MAKVRSGDSTGLLALILALGVLVHCIAHSRAPSARINSKRAVSGGIGRAVGLEHVEVAMQIQSGYYSQVQNRYGTCIDGTHTISFPAIMASLSLLLLAALCACVSASTFPSHAKAGRLWRLVQAEDQQLFQTEAHQFWFSQRLDHFEASGNITTFQQRYYQVDKFWTAPHGPVILYIGGEGALEQAPAGFVHVIAQKFGAKVTKCREEAESLPSLISICIVYIILL